MTSLPLPLAQVLADENARLYGDDAPGKQRWILRVDEIVDARALAQKLANRMASPPENIARWREENGHDPEYRQRVAGEVNDIFESLAPTRWLFEHEAFADAKQDPYTNLRRATQFDPDDVFNLNREIFDGLFPDEVRSAADVRFQEVVKRIHARAKGGTLRTALAISGGGIRSATYALGVIQGLARRHVLEKFDFLSTISGGGYIGGWLSSWVRRDPWGIRGVCSLLSSEPEDPLDPEPMPLKHLRAYSNYLIPKLSLFSADTWALASTYIRNVLLNWIVLIPLLAGLLAVPRFVLSAVRLSESPRAALYALLIGMLFLTVGFGTLVRFRPAIDSRKTKNLTDGRFVNRVLLPLLIAAVSLTLAWAWHINGGGNPIGPAGFLGAAMLATTAAFFVFLFRILKTQYAEKPMDAKAREKRQSMRLLGELGASVAAGVTGGVLAWVAAKFIFPEPVQALTRVGIVRWPIADPGGLSAATAAYVCFAVPLLLGILFLQAVIFVGAASHQNHDFDREWWARASGWVLLASIGWIGVSALAIFGPVAIYHLPGALSAVGGAAGIFSVLAGRSGKTNKDSGAEESTTSKAVSFGIGLAVPIFVLYILALISLGITEVLSAALGIEQVSPKRIGYEQRMAAAAHREYPAVIANEKVVIKESPLSNPQTARSYEHLQIIQSTPWGLALLIALGAPIVALIVSRCIGVNVFSMHAMYRNRIVRAYLGASRWSRDPNKFTGFDPQDNLGMHDLRPEYLWRHSFRDIDNAIGVVANAREPRLRLIHDEMRRQMGPELDRLFSPETDRNIARPAFYQSLNVLIASKDLALLFDPTIAPAKDTRRALRNRRFIEVAFGDSEIYPSPNALICTQDLRVTAEELEGALEASNAAALAALKKHVRHPGAPLLVQINDVIAEGSLSGDPVFAETNDPINFIYSDLDPLHRMIDNRLRIEKAFANVFEPLSLARPLHVIGICLNLTAGEELAWQERKGESFAVTPLASGSPWLGYRDSRHYGDISVGTAVTISGAAASPNMGYHSSPALAFLMTLFNVRLGWWLGNPGVAGNDTYERRNPKVSIGPLVHELTGNSNDKYKYVYLSDGGHFENLGLYEMVLRRVHRIVVTDGTGDPEFVYGDLGNAIRKIRIDLGVEIEIKEIDIKPPTEKEPGQYCAWGEIKYTGVDGPDAVNGELLYIKPVVYRNQGPRDVLNYQTVSPSFPHESTADQFFSESQFESYRRLGLFTVDQIVKSRGDARLADVSDFITAARETLHPAPSTEVI